jgi:hypothetical protein
MRPFQATSGVDRQLPAGDEIFLDHVANFVPDKDAARSALTRAGFTTTPFSVQTNRDTDGTERATGTGNTTAMLPRGYLEFLFKTANTALGREIDQANARYIGIHLIAFGVANAKAQRERLASNGFRVQPLVALRRPVGTENGTAEAGFTVTRVEPGEMAEGRIQMLTHHTEDAVWQKRWLAHPNGARELIDVVIAVPDMAEADARFGRFLNRKSAATNLGRAFFLDRGGVQLLEAAAFARVLPEISIPSLPCIGIVALGVERLDATEGVLTSLGNRFTRRERMLIAHFPAELGIGAWIFVENAADLPWRAHS